MKEKTYTWVFLQNDIADLLYTIYDLCENIYDKLEHKISNN